MCEAKRIEARGEARGVDENDMRNNYGGGGVCRALT